MYSYPVENEKGKEPQICVWTIFSGDSESDLEIEYRPFFIGVSKKMRYRILPTESRGKQYFRACPLPF